MIAVVLTIVALVAGMQVGGNGVDLFGLVRARDHLQPDRAAVGMRRRDALPLACRPGPLMQTPVFMVLFLAPVYVPLPLLSGWIHAVARLNPLTFLLESGRGFIEGQPTEVWPAAGIAAGLVVLFALWALRGLRAPRRPGREAPARTRAPPLVRLRPDRRGRPPAGRSRRTRRAAAARSSGRHRIVAELSLLDPRLALGAAAPRRRDEAAARRARYSISSS